MHIFREQYKDWKTLNYWVLFYCTEISTRTGKYINIQLVGVFYWTADKTRTGKHMNIELVGVFLLLDCRQYKDWQTLEHRTSWCYFIGLRTK